MTDPLPIAEARRRFYIYLAVKLGGVATLAIGVVLFIRTGPDVPAAVAVALGTLALLVRPRMLGLTQRR